MMLDRMGNDTTVGAEFKGMCKMMKEKCWGNPDILNVLIFIVVVFDPHFKMGYVEYGIKSLLSVQAVGC